MGLMARSSSDGFDQWVFAIDRRRRAPDGKTDLLNDFIGSIRRECLDHVVVFGDLRHVLLSYMNYYNEMRTHLSMGKDAPVLRAVERVGHINCRPVLGGLHHQYLRI
jgi:hypothetical protein